VTISILWPDHFEVQWCIALQMVIRLFKPIPFAWPFCTQCTMYNAQCTMYKCAERGIYTHIIPPWLRING
jgi:hypothetical protein